MNKINELEKKILFTSAEIAACFDTEMSRRYWLNSAIKENRVAKIRRGLYGLVNPATGLIFADKFMIASALSADAHIVYHSALEFHGLATQVYNTVYVSSVERFRAFEYGGIFYEYACRAIGVGAEAVASSAHIRVSDLERTVLDCIDDTLRAGGADELLSALQFVKKLDEVKLLEYLARYGKINLYHKTGYLLEKLKISLWLSDAFFAECKRHIGKHPVYFLDSVGALTYNRDWNIIAPAKLPPAEEQL
jgi:predicted transcriptional regulator of viral defense system